MSIKSVVKSALGIIRCTKNGVSAGKDVYVGKNVKFTGGCNGNLQAIPKLVEGLTVEEVEEKIGGISCNGRPTSCGDQLARACREAYNAEQNQ